MLVNRLSNAKQNQVKNWPSHDAHHCSAPFFFETRELRLDKAALAWNEPTLKLELQGESEFGAVQGGLVPSKTNLDKP